MSVTPDARQPLIIGHRGSPRRATENTTDSFLLALEEGAHGIETDLRRLSDGTIVLFHDALAGGERVEDLDTARLRALSGRDVVPASSLAEVSPPALRILEIKTRGWEAELLSLVADWDATIISSFDHRVLIRLRSLGWRGRLGAVLEGTLVRGPEYLAEIGADVYFPHVQFLDEEVVAAHVERGIEVIPWTVNLPEEARRVIAWGCAGVITDYPGLIAGPEGVAGAV